MSIYEARANLVAAIKLMRTRKTPALKLTAAIGLGIGGALAISATLFDTLDAAPAFSQSSALVMIHPTGRIPVAADGLETRPAVSLPDFQKLDGTRASFVSIGGFNTDYMAIVTFEQRAETACRIFVTAHTWETVRGSVLAGRSFGEADFLPGAVDVALVSESLAGPIRENSRIAIDDRPFLVAGVVPDSAIRGFFQRTGVVSGTERMRCVVTPLRADSAGEASPVVSYLSVHADAPWLTVVGRLRPGVSDNAVSAELASVGQALARENPGRDPTWQLAAMPYRRWHSSRILPVLWLLFGAAGIIVMAAVTNAAGIIMADSLRRMPEFAIRAALGADIRSIQRLIHVRSLAWCLPGSLVSCLVAAVVLGLFRRVTGGDALSDTSAPMQLGALLAAGLGFGAVAAGAGSGLVTRVLRVRSISDFAREHSTISTGPAVRRTSWLLLAVQVASAVALSVGSGLLARSLWMVSATDFGFDKRAGIVIDVRLPRSRYPTADEHRAFYSRALQRLEALPALESAGFTSASPLSGATTTMTGGMTIDTRGGRIDVPRLALRYDTPGVASALGVTLVRGRFSQRDDEIVVDETFGHRVLANDDPLGTTLSINGDPLAIVGVVRDVRASVSALDAPVEPGTAYLSFARAHRVPTWTFLVARARANPDALAEQVARELAVIDREAVIGRARSFAAEIADQTREQRRLALGMSLLAATILALMATSIAASLNQSIEVRWRDIAIRASLGASRMHVVTSVGADVGRAFGAGIAAGTVAGLLLAKWLGSLLLGVRSSDGLTVAMAVVGVAVATCIAAAPALLRAVRVDPAKLLGHT